MSRATECESQIYCGIGGVALGEILTITASDGHKLDTYLAQPNGSPKGGIVLIQEIFGVNSHMRSVADMFSAEGYLVCCPALFDRIERNIELGYSDTNVVTGRKYKKFCGNTEPLKDIEAALNVVQSAGKIGVVGYCWGGALSWLSACKVNGFSAASSYYGAGIGELLNAEPECPVIFHFGEEDSAIPMREVQKVKDAHPECPIYLYPAGHGFNCDQRASYHQASSNIALERTLNHLERNLN